MKLGQLSDEQIATWSLAEKDRWWKENVYQGDAPQLTLRSMLAGIFIGGTLTLTNLYVGMKTGWQLGVGITSVIISFCVFKIMTKFGAKDLGILENNAMQSIATSSGYMTGPLISSFAAYMMLTNTIVPMYQFMIWNILINLLGVLYAFPLKRRYINDEQLPFPEGQAAGVVMHGLHTGGDADGIVKGKIIGYSALLAGLSSFLRDGEKILDKVGLKILAIPENIEDFFYRIFSITPTILGTPIQKLTISMPTDIVLVGMGGLMGIKATFSMLLGSIFYFVIMAPILIKQGIIPTAGFRPVVMWSLWSGVAMMTTASLYSFFANPKELLKTLTLGKKNKGNKDEDVLKEIELPLKVSLIGIPILGIIMAFVAKSFFGVPIYATLLALPIVFILTVIAANATGLTSTTPTGAVSKITQVSYYFINPGSASNNLIAGGIAGETTGSASNLLMDIKPGYMLGAKPRQQAIGHSIGIVVGTLVAFPFFYYAILKTAGLSALGSEQMPMPAALTWKAVAELLNNGLSFLHGSAKIAMLIGALVGIWCEWYKRRLARRGKQFFFSPVAFGLAASLPFSNTIIMFLGALLFEISEKKLKKGQGLYTLLVENRETLSAGLIAGGALVGIIVNVVNLLI